MPRRPIGMPLAGAMNMIYMLKAAMSQIAQH
jgi:hypothetical protein